MRILNQIRQHSVSIIFTAAFVFAMLGMQVAASHRQDRAVDVAASVMLDEFHKCSHDILTQMQLVTYFHKAEPKEGYLHEILQFDHTVSRKVVDAYVAKCAVEQVMKHSDAKN